MHDTPTDDDGRTHWIDRDLLEASPSAGWIVTYQIMGAPLP